MKIYAAVFFAQVFLLVTGSDVPGNSKRVGCIYLGLKSERYGTLEPEDIDASICTHLTYLNGAINNETEEIEIKAVITSCKIGGEGDIPRLQKLKRDNPDLKLILHIEHSLYWVIMNSSRRANVIKKAVEWLNTNGFDGLDLPITMTFPSKEADFFCDIKSELDKHGFILTTILTEYLLTESSGGQMDSFSKIVRCCDRITLQTLVHPENTSRLTTLHKIKAIVEKFIERGLPPNKTQITFPAVGYTATLKDLNETGLGASISGPGNDDFEFMGGFAIHQSELLRKLSDSSLGWTFRRDNETKEPYAFTKTGLWISYEDTTSAEFKARYVLEKGLGGIDILIMEFEDNEGIGGEGRFPLTRAVYNTFGQANQSANVGN